MCFSKIKKDKNVEQLVNLMFSLRQESDILGSMSYAFPEDRDFLCSLRDEVRGIANKLFPFLESKGVRFPISVNNHLDETDERGGV